MAVQHAAALLYQFYTTWKSSLLISYLKPAETIVWPPKHAAQADLSVVSDTFIVSKQTIQIKCNNLTVSCKLIVLIVNHMCTVVVGTKTINPEKSALHVHFKCLCTENISSCKNNFCTFFYYTDIKM